MKVKVYISNDQREVKLTKGIRPLIRKCCKAVLAYESFDSDAEVSVSLVNNEEIQKLNKEYRGIDRPTDVLSFPLGENGEYEENHETGAKLLGDVVISMEKAVSQAEEYGHSFEREAAFLTVHSMFHLLGYDHETSDEDAKVMRSKEEEVLTELGVSRETSYTEK
ncbi:MAG: rRNA maturation RNase YbeY [Oscillospiraceae bacterium]|nr:rRNA maturation RNase YbeY [Oscillospiraceae bacterium]